LPRPALPVGSTPSRRAAVVPGRRARRCSLVDTALRARANSPRITSWRAISGRYGRSRLNCFVEQAGSPDLRRRQGALRDTRQATATLPGMRAVWLGTAALLVAGATRASSVGRTSSVVGALRCSETINGSVTGSRSPDVRLVLGRVWLPEGLASARLASASQPERGHSLPQMGPRGDRWSRRPARGPTICATDLCPVLQLIRNISDRRRDRDPSDPVSEESESVDGLGGRILGRSSCMRAPHRPCRQSFRACKPRSGSSLLRQPLLGSSSRTLPQRNAAASEPANFVNGDRGTPALQPRHSWELRPPAWRC
jgi:hypothetical protein